jgi:hypothetical protein
VFRGIMAVADGQLHCWHGSSLLYSEFVEAAKGRR